VPPRLSKISRNDTHRLIPSSYSDGEDSVLTRITDDRSDLRAIFELEGATNDRLLGEAGLLPGISLRELVFGIPHSQIVNATFTHANPLGSRFNGPDRGAWYAAFSLTTSQLEVAYHKQQELLEINWQHKETFSYVDFLADFRGDFHDIRDDQRFRKCLDPSSYAASQRLTAQLLVAGSHGIVYPSVRHNGGTCLACFRPALVNNVRKAGSISITFESASARPKFH
jgi:RES domain-containing protein